MKRSIEDHCSLSRIVFPETDSKILCRIADLPFVDPQTFSRPNPPHWWCFLAGKVRSSRCQ
jgi:hypothetical protein